MCEQFQRKWKDEVDKTVSRIGEPKVHEDVTIKQKNPKFFTLFGALMKDIVKDVPIHSLTMIPAYVEITVVTLADFYEICKRVQDNGFLPKDSVGLSTEESLFLGEAYCVRQFEMSNLFIRVCLFSEFTDLFIIPAS